MAREQEILRIDDTWQEITNADVAVITFQVLGGRVEIRRGDTSQPVPSDRGWFYAAPEGERGISINDLSSHTGRRVWAKAPNRSSAQVLVDHA